MFKNGLDIKMWFIIILGVGLILSLIFRPSPNIKEYEEDIENLKRENDKIDSQNDSLRLVNTKLNEEVKILLKEIDTTEQLLKQNNERIKQLENDKNKISDYVKSLDANGVAASLSDYLNR